MGKRQYLIKASSLGGIEVSHLDQFSLRCYFVAGLWICINLPCPHCHLQFVSCSACKVLARLVLVLKVLASISPFQR